MLLKLTQDVFFPGTPGRDYRAYSRVCPDPPPPVTSAPPRTDCTLVPIYGPAVPAAGSGAQESGAAQGTIVGYITVCAGVTSTVGSGL
jgi:hypothetical protein